MPRIVAARGGRTQRAAATAAATGGSAGIARTAVACFGYYMSVALTAPALPSYCNQIVAGRDTVTAEGVSLYGLFSTIDQLFTFAFTPIWGSLSDVYGRKPFMLLSSLGVMVGWLTVYCSRSIPVLLVGRAIDGITSCMQPIAQSAVADVSTPEELQKNLPLLTGPAIGGAFIFGAMSGGILTKVKGPDKAILAAACAGAATFLFVATFVRETRPPPPPRQSKGAASAASPAKVSSPVAGMLQLWRSGTSARAAGAFLLVWVALNGLQINFFNFASFRFGLDRVKATALQALSGVVLATSQGVLPRLLVPRLGALGTARLGIATFALGQALLGFAPTVPLFAAGVTIMSLGCVALPLLISVIVGEAPSSATGSALGALEQMTVLNRVLSYKLMSGIFAWSVAQAQDGGTLGPLLGSPGFFFYVGASFASVALMLVPE